MFIELNFFSGLFPVTTTLCRLSRFKCRKNPKKQNYILRFFFPEVMFNPFFYTVTLYKQLKVILCYLPSSSSLPFS